MINFILPTDDYFVSHTDKLFFPTRISQISRIIHPAH